MLLLSIPVGAIIITFFLVIAIISFFLKKKRNKTPAVIRYDIKPMDAVTPTPEEGFIAFACQCAEQRNIRKDPIVFRNFLLENFELLHTSYVYKIKEMSFLHDIPKVIQTAVEKYTKDQCKIS